MQQLSLILILLTRVVGAEPTSWDWREALLKEEGLELTPEALRQALKPTKAPTEQLLTTLEKLGSESFEEREAAQKKLLAGGEPVYQWLQTHPNYPQPEVRQRVHSILLKLGLNDRKDRENARGFAIRSLLDEGTERRKDTGGRFYEWFGDPSDKLEKSYHLFEFKNSVDRSGQIENGQLTFFGTKFGDGDQRFILSSKAWPGRNQFGSHFKVSARLGGEPKSAGAWHLGISIGNVRVLFHPGYRGGGFRFETVDQNTPLSSMTTDMGFNPDGDPLEHMTIEVRRLDNGKVSLTATVQSGGKKPVTFTKNVEATAKQIGPLSQISLDRSGRTGGSASFSDFSVILL